MTDDNLHRVVYLIHLEHIDVDPVFDLEATVVEMVPGKIVKVEEVFELRRMSQRETVDVDRSALEAVPEKRDLILNSIHKQEYERSRILANSIQELMSPAMRGPLVARILKHYGPRSLTHPLVQDRLDIKTEQHEAISRGVSQLNAAFREMKKGPNKGSKDRDELRRSFERLLGKLDVKQLKMYLFLRDEIKSLTDPPDSISGLYPTAVKNKLLRRVAAASAS